MQNITCISCRCWNLSASHSTCFCTASSSLCSSVMPASLNTGQPQQALYDVSWQLFLRFILNSHHLYVCRQRAAYTAAYVTAAALLLSAALHHYAQPQPADHGSTGTCFLGPLFHRPCKPSVKNFLLVPHILVKHHLRLQVVFLLIYSNQNLFLYASPQSRIASKTGRRL